MGQVRSRQCPNNCFVDTLLSSKDLRGKNSYIGQARRKRFPDPYLADTAIQHRHLRYDRSNLQRSAGEQENACSQEDGCTEVGDHTPFARRKHCPDPCSGGTVLGKCHPLPSHTLHLHDLEGYISGCHCNQRSPFLSRVRWEFSWASCTDVLI